MNQILVGPLLRHVGSSAATVWVETTQPCEVEVLGSRERSWTVAGHHYALVLIEGLAPGSSTPYEVRLDGELAWPPAGSARPPSRIRTLSEDRPVRIAFGSCRYATSAAVSGDDHFDADSLACYARAIAAVGEKNWPDALLLVGDQVYADETSAATQRRIRERRDISTGAGDQVADFEEYTWLYDESWADPDVRWLMSTVGTSMIFDDHDVRDDWNTSHLWREDMKLQSWWQERIVGALSSYWVYQHLGNLSPDELAHNDLYQRVRAGAGDAEPLLREFAAHADREADGAKGTRWSYRRDFGRVRLVMIDSRCGRILAEGHRSMVSESEFSWIEEQVDGEYDHLLIGTSLPWLLPRALHDIESWNEVLCAGVRGTRVAKWAEKMRRAADLEHWASFRESFDRLAALLASVGRGEHGGQAGAPATVCVLSGDVHHAYVAQAQYEEQVDSPVYQLTCSPLHNYVPAAMKVAFRISWSRAAERSTRLLLGTMAKLPPMPIGWKRMAGPYFGNEISTLTFDGRRAEAVLERSAPSDVPAELTEVGRITLSSG
ncbi:MAG: alkaline phosphatase family protein [Actinomycetota bacterium]|nr:alkaline phosphatase family protein [Actinomycetota bacterium]